MIDHAVRRVLQVHTRYREPGGEDTVVEAERRLLEDAGIEVDQVLFDNRDLPDTASLGRIALAASAIWSRRAARRVRAAVSSRRPDVVHVHNTFAMASPSVYWATGDVPVVQTVHNYRFVCPAATAFRDGRVCTDCVGHAPWSAVAHRCVRGSRSQSAVAATNAIVHRAVGTFGRISTYVALTSFQRELLIAGGLPADRIVVIPNFLEPDPGDVSEARSGLLFAGRLSTEKGISSLLAAAAMMRGTLRVAGDGPLRGAAEAAASRGEITYLGPLDRDALLAELRCTSALVVPSIWFEGLPMIIVEAYAAGTPVIASKIGSLTELVDDAVGMLVDPGDVVDLAEAMRWVVENPEDARRMGAAARRRYELRYRGAQHLDALLETYAASREHGLTRTDG